jgi:hypothetical protein
VALVLGKDEMQTFYVLYFDVIECAWLVDSLVVSVSLFASPTSLADPQHFISLYHFFLDQKLIVAHCRVKWPR